MAIMVSSMRRGWHHVGRLNRIWLDVEKLKWLRVTHGG
jgi:hypothetical protein